MNFAQAISTFVAGLMLAALVAVPLAASGKESSCATSACCPMTPTQAKSCCPTGDEKAAPAVDQNKPATDQRSQSQGQTSGSDCEDCPLCPANATSFLVIPTTGSFVAAEPIRPEMPLDSRLLPAPYSDAIFHPPCL